jgi:hypothetical protein
MTFANVCARAPVQADKIGGMRKLVAILLLSLMSLQVSWAAVAAYCQHEQGASVRHVGHHQHEHAAHSAGHETQPKAPAAGGDLDCSLCQAGCLPALVAQPELSAAQLSVSQLAEAVVPHPSSPPLDLPERPNWS